MLDDILIERCVCKQSVSLQTQLVIFQEVERSAQKLEVATSKTLLLMKASASGREKWTVKLVVDAAILRGKAHVSAVVLRDTVQGI
jgi:hypothetical protein